MRAEIPAEHWFTLDGELAGTGVRIVNLFPMGVIDTPTNRAAMPDADREDWIAPEALAEAGFPTDRLTQDQSARWRAALAARPSEIGYSEFRDRHPLVPEQVPEAWLGTRGVHLAPSQPEVMLAMNLSVLTRKLPNTAAEAFKSMKLSTRT